MERIKKWRNKRLYLEENLPKKNSRLNSFMFGTEDGIGFSYLQSLDSDNIEWYGYISWEDLLAGKNNIKTLVETKFTGGENRWMRMEM